MYAVTLALLLTAAPAREETRIREVHAAFAAAWAAGDAERAAAVFVPDGLRVDGRGGVQRGRAQLRDAYAQAFAGPMKGSTLSFSETEVRLLCDRFALWRGRLEITRPDGTRSMGYAVDLMEKRDGRWQVAETHPKLFP